jgi:hypothetical protein
VGKEPHQAEAVTADASTRSSSTNNFTMGIEDQIEEREVLESIFPEEITGSAPSRDKISAPTDTSADVSETEFRVAITLDDGRHEDEEREDEQRSHSVDPVYYT